MNKVLQVVPVADYQAALRLAHELALELRSRCADPLHGAQLRDIEGLMLAAGMRLPEEALTYQDALEFVRARLQPVHMIRSADGACGVEFRRHDQSVEVPAAVFRLLRPGLTLELGPYLGRLESARQSHASWTLHFRFTERVLP